MARVALVAPSRPPSVAPPRRRARLRWRIARFLLIVGIWAVLAAGVTLVWFARDLPRPEAALDAARRPGLTLQDRTGHSFATFGDVVGESLRLTDMPTALPQAVVSIEDRRFWSHPGIDVLGLARAFVVNLRSGRLRQGGSTITQQVAKNLFLTNARTLRRKVQELMLTIWLEQHFTKREILEIWLNRVYLGSGTWGVDAAAKLYFGGVGAAADALAVRRAGWDPARAVPPQPANRPGRGGCPWPGGADRHGRDGGDYGGPGAGGRGADRLPARRRPGCPLVRGVGVGAGAGRPAAGTPMPRSAPPWTPACKPSPKRSWRPC